LVFIPSTTPKVTEFEFASTTKAVIEYVIYRLEESAEESEWTQLSATVSGTTYTDNNWSAQPDGVYQYAIKAKYTGGLLSIARLTNMLHKGMTNSYTVNITTNSGDPVTGAVITLTNRNGNLAHVYTETATNNTVTFHEVWKGTYDISITLAGFDPYLATNVVIETAGLSHSATLIEIIVEPFNLEVRVDGTTATLSWNEAGYFFDDMEGHQDFIIENIGDYILYDGNGSPTYGFGGGVTFPNQGYIGSYIVFNPSQIPPIAGFEPIQPFSGNKFLACFASGTPPNNGWLILPKLKIAPKTIFEFWGRTYVGMDGLERFRIGVSTTGTTPADFTIISPGNYVQVPTTWTKYTYDLSAYAGQDVHVAINCVSNDAFIFMVDDIFLGVPEAKNSKSFGGFTVYLNGEEVASEVMETEYLFTDLANGHYTAGLEAVYTSGTSTMMTINFVVGETGITTKDREIFKVYPNPVSDELHIQTTKTIKQIDMLDLNGKVVKIWYGDNKTINVQSIPTGHYILRIHTENSIVPIKIVKQ
jgi:hypothetical protein